jgi:hypothetical protein
MAVFPTKGVQQSSVIMDALFNPISLLLLAIVVFIFALRDRKAHLKHIPLLNPSPRFALTSRKSKV